MRAKKHTVVVGVFKDRVQADKAIADLKKAGFTDAEIGVAMRHDQDLTSEVTEVEDTHAGSGALTGALTGLGLGALAGMGVLAGVIPVIGPAIAAGTLGVVLSNAAAGAGIAGLVGALVGAGVPEHEAKYYQSEFEAGRCIVSVHADARSDEASTILRRFGAYDMSSRETGSIPEEEEIASSATSKRRTARTADVPARDMAAGDTIEVKEERLHAEKHPVEAGEVRVRKEVHTETKTLEVPVEREEIVIERTPVSRKATSKGVASVGAAEETIRIPVREEQVTVSKDTVVTEEVKIGKQVVRDTKRVTGQVRKEEVHVDQKGDVEVRQRGSSKKST